MGDQHADCIAENAWRFTMENPCTCPPRPSTDECPRVEECYQAWCEATLIRADDPLLNDRTVDHHGT